MEKNTYTIREELLSLSAINPWAPHDSSPRGCMFLTQLSQAVTLDNPEPRIVQTGLEYQLYHNTFSIEIEDDFIVKAIVSSHPNKNIDDRPMVTILGAYMSTGEIDCYDIPYHHMLHTNFGYKYIKTEELKNIYVGTILPKGTILAKTPGMVDNTYAYGVNANIALITDPATGQDGVIISKSFAKKLRYKVYTKGSLEWGVNSFPLNLYGDENSYKAFPNIGEPIHHEQVFAAIRDFNKDISPALVSVKDTREFDPMFDRAIYLKPDEMIDIDGVLVHSSKVVDLKLYSAPNNKKEALYNREQTTELYTDTVQYHKQVVSAYENIIKNSSRNMSHSHRLQRKIVESKCLSDPDNKLRYTFRSDKLDTYRLDFIVEHTVIPGIGAKISDAHTRSQSVNFASCSNETELVKQ